MPVFRLFVRWLSCRHGLVMGTCSVSGQSVSALLHNKSNRRFDSQLRPRTLHNEAATTCCRIIVTVCVVYSLFLFMASSKAADTLACSAHAAFDTSMYCMYIVYIIYYICGGHRHWQHSRGEKRASSNCIFLWIYININVEIQTRLK